MLLMMSCVRHGIDADGGEGPEDGGQHRGDQRQHHRKPQRGKDHLVLEQALVPAQREAGKDGAAFAFVEAVGDEHGDGQVHESEDQHDVGALEQAFMLCFHYITPSISSSSKLEVKLMQSRTITISARLMAEPRLRL